MIAAMILTPALVLGQSLAEIAEKEKQRRKQGEQKGAKPRTFTSDDLAKNKGQLATDPGAVAATPSPGATPLAPAGRRGPAATPPQVRDEASWRAEAQKRRAAVARADQIVQYAESLANAMAYGAPRMSDDGTTNWEAKRAQVLKDLEEARAQLARARQSLADLEDEVRHAGAQPGWIRD